MKIMDFLSKKAIVTDIKSIKKEEVIKELVEALINSGDIEKRSRNKLIDALMARESLGSTAIGQGIAIPHAKSDCVDKLVAAFGLSGKGVDFDSLDGMPTHLFFVMAAPPYDDSLYLKVFKALSENLRYENFRQELMDAQVPYDVIRAFKNVE